MVTTPRPGSPARAATFIVGDSSADTLAFTGAGDDEVMSLAADGRSAVFLRSPGAIRMDLDGDGADRVDVTDAAKALIAVLVDLGVGQ